jgi:hypothetical protein
MPRVSTVVTADFVREFLIECVALYESRPCTQRRAELGPEAFALEFGEAHRPVPWETWQERGFRQRAEMRCFNNAKWYAGKYPSLLYVEGWAAQSTVGPMEHAWCVDPDGCVVDLTWRDVDERAEYYGVVFPPGLARRLMVAPEFKYLSPLSAATLFDAAARAELIALAKARRPASTRA